MRTLHWYLLKEVLATVLMTVGVFTFVLLLGNVLSEILGLLVNAQVGLRTVAMSIVLLIPFVLVFALPMGLLTATLLVFGRCSADQELTATRANGISLMALTTPVLLLSCGFSVLSGWINMEIAPRCRVAYKRLLFQAGAARSTAFLPEKVFIKDFPGLIVYVDKAGEGNLKDILIYELDRQGKFRSYVRAAAGRLQANPADNTVTVLLSDAWRVEIVEGKGTPEMFHTSEAEFVYTNQVEDAEGRVKLSDMTIFQLFAELRDLEKRVSASDLAGLTRQLEKHGGDVTLPLKMQIHRQFSFSFACIAFTLVGIPLGIRAHRRETTFGVAMSLILVTVYYSFFILANALDHRPDLFPHLLLWLPNFLFETVGMFLLWRANTRAW